MPTILAKTFSKCSQMRFRVEPPPLRNSYPDSLLSRPPHVGEPRNDRRRPSAMRGPARQSEFQAAASTPLSRQRVKRQWVSLQPPVSGGARYGAPARIIRKTALTRRRLSRAPPPQLPSRSGKRGSGFSRIESEISRRLWAAMGMYSSLVVEDKRTMPQNKTPDNLVTTLPK